MIANVVGDQVRQSDTLNSVLRLKRFWVGCATFLLMALVATAFVGEVHFNFGSHTVQFSCQRFQASDQGELFFHVQWDGPTGDFTSGDNYGVRFGKWCLRFDIIDDPVGANKRRLPRSI